MNIHVDIPIYVINILTIKIYNLVSFLLVFYRIQKNRRNEARAALSAAR